MHVAYDHPEAYDVFEILDGLVCLSRLGDVIEHQENACQRQNDKEGNVNQTQAQCLCFEPFTGVSFFPDNGFPDGILK